ncbi:MAG TPA: DUF4331 domain-containing protein [Ideonella sp.]|nr:DUF4331 domain-containing protein [Ideonella sp.]
MKPTVFQRPLVARTTLALAAATALAAIALPPAQASSHREAPFISGKPRVDGTDFYMFSSYEPGRDGYVTLVANYLPLQDPYGGPNYFQLDSDAVYDIHIDNNGDAKEDLTFRFRFNNALKGITLPIGSAMVPIPLIQAGGVSDPNAAALNVNETYTVQLIRGDRVSGQVSKITNAATHSAVFDKPVDNIGSKTLPDYAGYAGKHLYSVDIPGCAKPARMFVGQRKDPFAVNLGKIFDLINIPVEVMTDPTKINSQKNTLADKNVTALELEVHKSCLTRGAEPVIGGWTTASVPSTQVTPTPTAGKAAQGGKVFPLNGRGYTQVSRLGMPLVNEVVIGLPDKDKWNYSEPTGDGQFLTYVTNPTLPALFEIAQGLPGTAPTNFPRNDLVTTFLLGLPGVNQPAHVVASEMLRLNTSIPATPEAQQNRLGVPGGDAAGYPNGRRPKDDVVDISLVAVMGGLCVLNGDTNALGLGTDCKPAAVPLGATSLVVNDAVDQAAQRFLAKFPYLNTPIPGSK